MSGLPGSWKDNAAATTGRHYYFCSATDYVPRMWWLWMGGCAMTEKEMEIAEAIIELAHAVRAVAHGGITGPGGIEGLTMAFVGNGADFSNSVVNALDDAGRAISSELHNVSESLDGIAGAIRESAGIKVVP